jgi:epoxyqueuosine reductase
MSPYVGETAVARIVERARELGASLAGIASVELLGHSPSYEACDQVYRRDEWPQQARSVLVLALLHDPSMPELDWWSMRPGGTLGNRQLARIAAGLMPWLARELGIHARPVPYGVERGGVFLKDAAALAGLGVVGRNNLLITPEFGPRVRLRALFLDTALEPGGPMDFDLCATCDMPCRTACPEGAFRDGSYSNLLCSRQMATNEANRAMTQKTCSGGLLLGVVMYCRDCELACVVGA